MCVSLCGRHAPLNEDKQQEFQLPPECEQTCCICVTVLCDACVRTCMGEGGDAERVRGILQVNGR